MKIQVFLKQFIEPPIYIGKIRLICGGILLNFFQKASYYNWKLQREKLMVYTNFFS